MTGLRHMIVTSGERSGLENALSLQSDRKKSTKKTTMLMSEIYASSYYVFPNM